MAGGATKEVNDKITEEETPGFGLAGPEEAGDDGEGRVQAGLIGLGVDAGGSRRVRVGRLGERREEDIRLDERLAVLADEERKSLDPVLGFALSSAREQSEGAKAVPHLNHLHILAMKQAGEKHTRNPRDVAFPFRVERALPPPQQAAHKLNGPSRERRRRRGIIPRGVRHSRADLRQSVRYERIVRLGLGRRGEVLEELLEDRGNDRIRGVLRPHIEEDIGELGHELWVERRLIDTHDGTEGLENEGEDLVTRLGKERDERREDPVRQRLDGRRWEVAAEAGGREMGECGSQRSEEEKPPNPLLDRLDGRDLNRDAHTLSLEHLDGRLEVLSGKRGRERSRVLGRDDEGSALEEGELWRGNQNVWGGNFCAFVRSP